MQAYEILNKYDGVFLSDVVGLGKTFMGSALLKQLGKRAVVICPPRLQQMWEEFGEKFEVDVKTISQGMLNKGVFDEESALWTYKDREIVLIDESDKFRNSDSKRYREIQPFLAGKKVILVTATPQNTSIWNIYHQIRLFNQEGTNEYQVKGGSLKEFFDFVYNNDPESRIQDLLSKILIRRTRTHIKKFYQSPEDLFIDFPKRELATVSYNIDDTYNNLYDKIKDALSKLTYARYNLWPHVVEEKKEDSTYLGLRKVTGLLKGLHRVMLFKRLESSIFAFSETINRLLRIHRIFWESMERGIIPAGEEAQDILHQEDIIAEDEFEELREASKDYRLEDFEIDKLKQDIQNDIDIFEEISNYLKKVPEESDKKLDELIAKMEKHRGHKILIFSEYADTVRYLYRRINGKFDNVTYATSKEGVSVVKRFAPESNDGYKLVEKEGPIDVLVSTDVLSRGQNLQDCGIIINYDLHWNPVRLIQRVGRVDRIGSHKDIINVYNFLPHKRVEEEISLRERVHNRAQEIQDYIGEDERILDESEKLNKDVLYAIYEKKDIEALEKRMQEEEGFSMDEAEMIIEKLKREKPEYLNYIKSLQPGTRSCKKSENYKGVFAYFRKGDVESLYISDEKGKVISDINKVIAEIRCSFGEKQIAMGKENKQLLSVGLRKLEEKFKKEFQDRTGAKSKKEPIIIRAVQKLVKIRRETKNDEDLELIDKISSILNRGISDEAIKDLKRFDRTEKEGTQYLRGLIGIYNRYRLGDIEFTEPEDMENKPLELVCCEVLK